MGYAPLDDVTKTLDQAESMMYDVAQRRVSDTMVELRDLLDASLDRLESLYERGEAITGTPSGYTDLDELTAGLQPNALVVVGARPGMGKTSFALGMAGHAALEAHRPVLFFSLEMSRIELTQPDSTVHWIPFGAWSPRRDELARAVLQAARWQGDRPEAPPESLG